MYKKFKSLLLDDTVYIGILLVLVASGSFGLGRLSQSKIPIQESAKMQAASFLANSTSSPSITPPVAMAETKINSADDPVLTDRTMTVQNFTASKSGTKYHKLSCPGAKQIKESNKIFFATENEAQAAGYTRAANCAF